MPSSFDPSTADDDLSRQRRKRESRLLRQPVAGFATLTVADVVADVLAASDEGRTALDVPVYLAEQGYGWHTIETVIGYLDRHEIHPARAPEASGMVTVIPRLG